MTSCATNDERKAGKSTITATSDRSIGVIEHDGRTGVVLERLGGTDMLTLLRRQALQVLECARTLAATHLAVQHLTAPGDLANQREVLAGLIAFYNEKVDLYIDGVIEQQP